LAVGASAVLLAQRLREVVEEEDAEAIAERLSLQLAELESGSTRQPSRPKPRKRKPQTKAG
jgi:hypothetical protein